MKALVPHAGRAKLVDRPEPIAPPGEVVLEVLAAGICSTDLEIAKGYMGFDGVLGHEVVARVIDGPDVWRGKRVAVEINCSCHTCSTCRAGLSRHCPTRTVLGIAGRDGALAERFTAPIANLHALPDGIADDVAVFVEPLAAAVHTFDDAVVRPGDRVLVIGDGKLGLLIALGLSMRSDVAEATLLGRHAAKLGIAAKAGLHTFDRPELAPAKRYDVVVDATGRAEGLELAMRAVRPRGTIALKSTYAGGAKVDLAPIVIDEITVVGSRCGTFERAIDALEKGKVDPRPLLTATYSLGDAEVAFDRAKTPGVLKVIVRP